MGNLIDTSLSPPSVNEDTLNTGTPPKAGTWKKKIFINTKLVEEDYQQRISLKLNKLEEVARETKPSRVNCMRRIPKGDSLAERNLHQLK